MAGIEIPEVEPGIRQLAWSFGDVRHLSSSAATSAEIRESWRLNLPTRHDELEHWPKAGLRRPQLGAVHAMLAAWSTGSVAPSTVVLPTGSGKTDTMLVLLAAAKFERLLVVVPTNALRRQIASRFETFGVLRARQVLDESAINPRVSRLTGGAKDAAELRSFLEASDAIVTTPNAMQACSEDARALLTDSCSAVFFDEAHHVRARTWSELRDAFRDRPVVQFTATPFREDNLPIDGRLVYAFPLREAQADGIFGKIRYRSVFDLHEPDKAIAETAVTVLRADVAAGFDHILMARCDSQKAATELHELYAEIASDLRPVLLHAGIGVRRRREVIDSLEARESRVVVCVDMLGEGFDMPALKVAAFHAPRKSLAPTLQLVGRFARVDASVGDATVVAARTERLLDRRISRLYGEDADWNELIEEISESSVGSAQELSDFDAGFGTGRSAAVSRAIAPKMSAVVFETTCDDWDPYALRAFFGPDNLLTDPIVVNENAKVAWLVVRSRSQVGWLDSESVENVTHALFVLHWDAARGLLFINHSSNEGVFHGVAEAVCGDTATLIRGDQVYRSMGGIDRAVPTNVGVLDIFNDAKRFSMFAGADVSEGFSDAEESTKVQTNIFVVGFRDGERATAGASLKGRMWSYQAAKNLLDWVTWCSALGVRLLDERIDVDEIRRNFIRPVALSTWPDDIPVLALEWPTHLLMNDSEVFRVRFGGEEAHLYDLDIHLDNPGVPDPDAKFTVSTDEFSCTYELAIGPTGMVVRATGDDMTFDSGRRQVPGADFMSSTGLVALMGSDAVVSPPGVLLRPDREATTFDPARIVVRTWAGINLAKESRGQARDESTVQGSMLADLLREDWDVIVDDDGAGEIADLVALKRRDSDLRVAFIHCKFAQGGSTGARVADLYELCGQAQKSAGWRREPRAMLQKLVRRERSRIRRGRRTGLERGGVEDLIDMIEDLVTLRTELEITIVQPALLIDSVSTSQLELLGSTDTYVRATAGARLVVVGSDTPRGRQHPKPEA